MNTIKTFSLIIGLLLILGCSKDYDLEKTVFFYDPDFPDLPVYSEWGYNTFGAYYDRQAFVSTSDIEPLKVIVKNDTTYFKFSGRLNNYKSMSVTFTMDNFLPETYEDLISLDKQLVDLKDPHIGIKIKIDDIEQEILILSGSLEFIKVQNLFVDKVEEEVILSGVFEFKVEVDKEPFSVSRGRFDVGVNDDNFFKY